MQKDLVDANDGGYYAVHISQEHTCTIAGIGKCRVKRGVFAWHIVEIIEAPQKKEKRNGDETINS